LPAELHALVDRLTIDQLAAIRFASDAEVPSLVQRLLQQNIVDRDAIKALITTWRPDDLRA
jgi:predicted transcriptional regulator